MKKTLMFLATVATFIGVFAQQPKPLALTTETQFVDIPDDCYWISDLEDGAWTVKHGNTYAFFSDDGSKLFDFEWQAAGNRDPKMLCGAVIMYKKNENYNKPQYLLYSDGSVKELPADWTGAATNFVDGVALIGKKNGLKMDYIYINVKGERVYGNLVSFPERVGNENHTLPGLSEGLRAYSDPTQNSFLRKWGYIDANGNVVIPAKYDKCRSFSGGYALVKDGNDIYFIDKKGNKAITIESDIYFNDVSDVRDGYFVINSTPRKYYNTKGEKVYEAYRGTWFFGGYAFCDDADRYNGVGIVLDKNFKAVDKIVNVESSWDDFGCTPVFTKAGVATVHGERVISPDGSVLIQHYPAVKERPNNYGIENFTASGYAKAHLVHNGVRYDGFINLDGEFVIVYKWDKRVTALFADENNPIIDKINKLPKYPKDSTNIQIKDPKPIGPKNTARHEYTVTVSAEPAQGGSVSGGGKYHLGDNVKLGATPKDGWKLKEWKCTTPGYYNKKLPNGVTMDGKDLSFVAVFIKIPTEDSIIEVEKTNRYMAHQSFVDKDDKIEFDVYMELSAEKNIETPYGKNTYGFLTCIIDGTKPFEHDQLVNGKKAKLSYKMFFVPMRISGIIKQNNKRYLVMDGGQVLISDIKLGGGADLLTALFVNSTLSGTFGTMPNARYRIELNEYDENTGECTLGELYRFHPDMGWIEADKYPVKHKSTAFMTKTEDNTIKSEFFKGLRMKTCAKQNVEFVPPKGWIQEGYDDAVKNLLEQMGGLVTDYETTFNKK